MSDKQKPASDRNGPNEANLLDDARGVAIDSLVEMLAGIHRGKQAREDVREQNERRSGSSGDKTPRVEVAPVESASDFLYDLARTQIGMVNMLLQFQRRHAGYLAERMKGTNQAPQHQDGSEGLVVFQGTLRNGELRAPADSSEAKFIVENRSTQPAHVELRLSELRSRDGNPPIRATAVFGRGSYGAKPQFELKPDQEIEVCLRSITHSAFKHGVRYRGHIEISFAGRPIRKLPIRIDVLPDKFHERT